MPRSVRLIRKKSTCFSIGDVRDRRRERYQSWEVPDWDARSARAQSMTLGVVTMVTSIKNGVPYVCFSCHTWSSNGSFIAFLPSTLPLWLSCFSDRHTGSRSCDSGSKRHSFREKQPAESLQLGKKQAVLEHAEWTYRYTTYRWWIRAFFRASVGGRQHSDNHGKFSLLGTLWWLLRHWAHRNELQGIWGFNQTNFSENEACCHTQNSLNADKTLRLLPSFEKRFCDVACASSTQPIFKIQQPKGRKTLYYTKPYAIDPTNRASAQQIDRRRWGHMPYR